MTQEALANVYRHAAASLVKIRLVARHGAFVHLLIEDNGIGFGGEARRPAEPGVGITFCVRPRQFQISLPLAKSYARTRLVPWTIP